ncbi:hypothetical protein [Prauserella muralis]|uniref:Uncharacterized protein n=1 Tax=Prauserella muralis TaxID=588067 RepID=A0A2V4BBA0_9PSEU|nr:hypothetical protein [Prauserella muralis]PXY31792.1 hypothetical protein BAY60_05460 [Prauserella muralis]TWE13811.1 hypothetical protein FHX69_5939 [Prauserella muralis]
MTDDFYRRIGGIREPDPTLGKNVPRKQPSAPQPGEDQQPSPQPEPQPPPKIRRQRVVLAEPSRSPSSLRARVELEQQTSWGELLIKDLIKVQLRTGLLLTALVVLPLGALPLAFFLSPDFAELRLIGLPVAWLLLGVAPFPLLFGAGLWYNRLAERHERDFVDMIEN